MGVCVCMHETMRRLVNVQHRWLLVSQTFLMLFDSEARQVIEQEERVGSAVIQHQIVTHASGSVEYPSNLSK